MTLSPSKIAIECSSGHVWIIPGGRLNTSVISKGWIAVIGGGIPAIQNN
jgi:hypothetical protein